MLIKIQTFSFKKMHFKVSSTKWRPFCLGLNVLMCPDATVRPHFHETDFDINYLFSPCDIGGPLYVWIWSTYTHTHTKILVLILVLSPFISFVLVLMLSEVLVLPFMFRVLSPTLTYRILAAWYILGWANVMAGHMLFCHPISGYIEVLGNAWYWNGLVNPTALYQQPR